MFCFLSKRQEKTPKVNFLIWKRCVIGLARVFLVGHISALLRPGSVLGFPPVYPLTFRWVPLRSVCSSTAALSRFIGVAHIHDLHNLIRRPWPSTDYKSSKGGNDKKEKRLYEREGEKSLFTTLFIRSFFSTLPPPRLKKDLPSVQATFQLFVAGGVPGRFANFDFNSHFYDIFSKKKIVLKLRILNVWIPLGWRQIIQN